jgi:hypothetical protein
MVLDPLARRIEGGGRLIKLAAGAFLDLRRRDAAPRRASSETRSSSDRRKRSSASSCATSARSSRSSSRIRIWPVLTSSPSRASTEAMRPVPSGWTLAQDTGSTVPLA